MVCVCGTQRKRHRRALAANVCKLGLHPKLDLPTVGKHSGARQQKCYFLSENKKFSHQWVRRAVFIGSYIIGDVITLMFLMVCRCF
jgi:hypothetical protein